MAAGWPAREGRPGLARARVAPAKMRLTCLAARGTIIYSRRSDGVHYNVRSLGVRESTRGSAPAR